MQQFFMIILSVGMGVVGQILLKYGAIKSQNTEAVGIMNFINLPNFFGLAFYGLSALLWMIVLRKVDLSYAYPMVSFGYVFVIIASALLFGETINLMKIAGMIFIVVGILFIAKS
ncbi:SMR family transporter [Bacillus mycoides]|uniref:SMR family transporter n=1 Tax=Bacillus mycoides TaxID=1405 RepID=UPI0021132118|nr:SMR family transporter [Bacillus mycoides]MCQ6531113.1 SMR family transporter [Bacillus mycoides]